MIFVSSGHNSKSITIKQDAGATGNGHKEGDLTIEFKHLVQAELTKLGCKYVSDTEEENLKTYLDRIQTGKASVVIEYHFDAGSSSDNGTTGVIEEEADRLDRLFTKTITDATSNILRVINRGLITEAESHRGRLGLMREEGIICLAELCFITNKNDIDAYHKHKVQLAQVHAGIIKQYEDLLK